MRRLDLGRLLRGPQRRAVEDVLALLPDPCRIDDAGGKTIVGAAAGGTRHAIVSGGNEIGVVEGGPGADKVARLVAHLFDREQEKLALAAETLGRYKELTVLYDMSAALSRVLDVREVASMVVAEARRFLGAAEASILLLDRRGERLEAIAEGSGAAPLSIDAKLGVEGRVIATGSAELVEDVGPEAGGGSLVCAPLRTGERVFGLLRVASPERARWNAGDLKLVTSLAANAAAAISHATLHRDQLRQQALRNRIERFVSPSLVEIALTGHAQSGDDAIAVLVFDVGDLARALDPDLSDDEVLSSMLRAASIAVDVLLEHEASVSTAQGEMIVALFGREDGFGESARAAARAASALVRRLDRRFGGPLARCPGVGVARVADVESFFAGVGAAATLQSAADGRILVDPAIAEVLAGAPEREGGAMVATPAREPLETVSGTFEVHEVQP